MTAKEKRRLLRLVVRWRRSAGEWRRLSDAITIRDLNGDLPKKDRCSARADTLSRCSLELLEAAHQPP